LPHLCHAAIDRQRDRPYQGQKNLEKLVLLPTIPAIFYVPESYFPVSFHGSLRRINAPSSDGAFPLLCSLVTLPASGSGQNSIRQMPCNSSRHRRAALGNTRRNPLVNIGFKPGNGPRPKIERLGELSK